MVGRLVGVEKIDTRFRDRDDSSRLVEYHAQHLHFIVLDTIKNTLQGNIVAMYKIKDSDPLSVVPLNLEKEYTFFVNKWDKLEYLSENAPATDKKS